MKKTLFFFATILLFTAACNNSNSDNPSETNNANISVSETVDNPAEAYLDDNSSTPNAEAPAEDADAAMQRVISNKASLTESTKDINIEEFACTIKSFKNSNGTEELTECFCFDGGSNGFDAKVIWSGNKPVITNYTREKIYMPAGGVAAVGEQDISKYNYTLYFDNSGALDKFSKILNEEKEEVSYDEIQRGWTIVKEALAQK